MKSPTRLAGAAGLVLGLLSFSGCGTTPEGGLTELQIEATGDPGVEVQIVTRRGDVPVSDLRHIVPVSVRFDGPPLDVVCIHGDKPGDLKLQASSGQNTVYLGASKPGAVIKIKLRSGQLKASSPTVRAAGTGI